MYEEDIIGRYNTIHYCFYDFIFATRGSFLFILESLSPTAKRGKMGEIAVYLKLM